MFTRKKIFPLSLCFAFFLYGFLNAIFHFHWQFYAVLLYDFPTIAVSIASFFLIYFQQERSYRQTVICLLIPVVISIFVFCTSDFFSNPSDTFSKFPAATIASFLLIPSLVITIIFIGNILVRRYLVIFTIILIVITMVDTNIYGQGQQFGFYLIYDRAIYAVVGSWIGAFSIIGVLIYDLMHYDE